MYRTSAPRVRSGSNLHLHDLHLRVFQYGYDFSMFVKFSWIHLHVWTAAKLICSDFVGGNFVVWEHKSRPGTGFSGKPPDGLWDDDFSARPRWTPLNFTLIYSEVTEIIIVQVVQFSDGSMSSSAALIVF